MGSRRPTSDTSAYFGGRYQPSSLPWWVTDENLNGVVGGSKAKSVYSGTGSDPGYVETAMRKTVTSDTITSASVIVDDDGKLVPRKDKKKEKKVLWRQIRVTTLTEHEDYRNEQLINARPSTTQSTESTTTNSKPITSSTTSSTALSNAAPSIVPSIAPPTAPLLNYIRPQYSGPLTVSNYAVAPTLQRPYIPVSGRAANSNNGWYPESAGRKYTM